MNTELFRYKLRLITLLLIAGYAFLHMQLADIFVEAPLEKVIDFTVRLPYGQRLLLPAIAHFLQPIFHLDANEVFFLLECLFVSLFFWANYRLLRLAFNHKTSLVLNWLFILLLPLISVINYRYTLGGIANFYYACDSASLFFTAAGMYLCLRQQWIWFIALIFIATFNRESAVLLVFLIPALHWPQFSKKLTIFVLAALTYLLARVLIFGLTSDLPGTLVEWYFRSSPYSLFITNMTWLIHEAHLLLFSYCFAALPLFCFTFYDFLPKKFRPLRYLVLVYFLGLMSVGILMESRIYHEIMVLLYFPVCIAIANWLRHQPVLTNDENSWSYYLDRYGILLILVAVILLQKPINALIHFLIPSV